ncbi:MAG TPA: Vi polysaccharide biosynthesis UDP-N-acetylglucosamine C-6 dehydrogenase TviB [Ignavibacteriales bacterium]|nr:Vi polysaccharide biosynthesis UDP-N-acetylglucosamine C-6 dehydrogenase TviB [Ignavibacteriales bacterium]HRR19758.1 Vi polysaccharide biosynthesis UDP-N-acetylglucosamine C-6 dehydrogenase TviB [Ignavibacteriales bacterium]
MDKIKIAVIGLGYVGLPLAVEFGKHFNVVGFDINKYRIEQLKKHYDKTLEISQEEFAEAKNLTFSYEIIDIKDCSVYIITVPTPVDKYNTPDLTPLLKASETVGKVISKGDIVIYESTVYPGCTEEECIPVIEKVSGLKLNQDFFVGYSPERINPGDKKHRLTNVVKIVSGSTPETLQKIYELYSVIVKAGLHKADSIKIAEAAKVIENTQRDINIAFVNELAMLFDALGIDTLSVLEAAGTKWNFLPFKPGLVGGHCIGVDPYYLTHKAKAVGYHPEIILAGRRINDNMGYFIAHRVIKLMSQKKIPVYDAKILVLGITFKENCPDIKNSKVVDIINELKEHNCKVDVFDPWADKSDVMSEYGIKLLNNLNKNYPYDVAILAVAHREFEKLNILDYLKDIYVLFDVKGILPKEIITGRL